MWFKFNLKVLIKILAALALLTVLAFTVFAYAISNGFRDYTSYCANFIPQLEQHYKNNGQYPETLKAFKTSAWDFRYNYKECGYHPDHQDNSFIFFFGDGWIDVVGYDSKTKQWWRD